MKKLQIIILITAVLSFSVNNLHSQNKLPFGDITYGDLLNKPYKPDPGADALILSDQGIASLNYNGKKFYVELVRDVKIRIVNSNGFDYADIELPFMEDDEIIKIRASTFNISTGEIKETPVPRKSFITDKISGSRKVIKFNFPDVHEGSVLEYSYTVRLESYAVNVLVPWLFQSDMPVVNSTFSVLYPEYFTYKHIISGAANLVYATETKQRSYFFNESMNVNVRTWSVRDMPAFKPEPYIKSWYEHITRINFEIASVNFPGSSLEEITPSYETLPEKLLEMEDFGLALQKTGFLKEKALEITEGLNDNSSKLKKIHEFVSNKILWDGEEDYFVSAPLRKIYNKEKGNSADINFILIGMLRAVNIKADPVILSTRSNGSINKLSAMVQQFNYVVAYVFDGNDFYLVDATDPLRPFNILPFKCLNGVGRLIHNAESRFIDLKNHEKKNVHETVTIVMDANGSLEGTLKTRYKSNEAVDMRSLIKLEGEDGYFDLIKTASTELEIKDINLENLNRRDSDLVEIMEIKISNGAQIAGDKLLFNPFLSPVAEKNVFYSETRSFPIDYGIPVEGQIIINLEIPDGFSFIEKPSDFTCNLGNNGGNYKFTCIANGNKITITSLITIDKTVFQPSEYSAIREFYSNILKKQAELIVIKKDV